MSRHEITRASSLGIDVNQDFTNKTRVGLALIQRFTFLAGLGLFILLALPALGWAQAFVNGSIAGVVTDNTGAVIPNAKMTLTNEGTDAVSVTQTNGAGLYQFLDLAPGNYAIQAEKEGFSQYVRKPITVEVNATVRIDITLRLGAISQKVTVTAATPLLQAQTSSMGQVVASRAVNELPLNGRNPLALIELVSGVIPEESSGTTPVAKNPFVGGNFEIEGSIANAASEYWDGAPLNTAYEHNLALVPTQDAIQEFKVQTSDLPAQYGRFMGGIVNLSTKSGTNAVHGVVDEYLRNKALNANEFFDNSSGIPVPAFTQNQFDVNIGGPVVIPHVYDGKNKTFFFFSYGGFRLRQGQALLLSVPTQAERQGDFSSLRNSSGSLIPIYNPLTTCGYLSNPACATGANGQPVVTRQQFAGNIIPTQDFDSAAKSLENLWALPNVPGEAFTSVDNWAGNAASGGDINQETGRLDHIISDKQRIFARYTFDDWNSLAINPFGTGGMVDAIPGGGQPEQHREQQVVLDDVYSFSPMTLADVNVSFLDQYYNRTAVSTGYNLGSLGPGWAALNDQVSYRTLPSVSVSGLDGFIANTGSEIREKGYNYDLSPNITTIKGRQTLQFGGELEVERFNYIQLAGAGGTFSFSPTFTALGPTSSSGGGGFASFLLGDAASGSIPTAVPVATQEIYPAFYVEDNLKASRKLTFNLGLRYERMGPPTERFNRESIFDYNVPSPLAAPTGLPLKGAFELVDSPDQSSRYDVNPDGRQFSPRVGLAYQLTRNTVLRAGYGIVWVPNDLNWNVMANNNPINLYTNTMTSTVNGGATPYNTLSNPFPTGLVQPPQRTPSFQNDLLGASVSNVAVPNAPYSYAQQWNFDVQRILPGNTFLDVAYAGSNGVHLPLSSEFQLDELPLQDMAMGEALLTSVANPFYRLIPTGPLSTATTTAGQLLRPYPQYNGLSLADGDLANSHFNSLQVTLRKNFSGGETLIASYTLSKLITNATGTFNSSVDDGGISGIQNYNDLAAEESLASFDTPQRLVVGYVVDLPVGSGKKFLSSASGIVKRVVSGWGADGMTTFQSGFPLQLTTSSNLTNSYGGGSRPNFNAAACRQGATLGGPAPSRLSRWFNTACYTQPPAFTFGNVSATLPNVRTDGIDNWDIAFFKDNTFGPENRFDLQFRAEFFNLFNHPQFDYPGQTFGTSQFGVVSEQLNNPRLIQFALKFTF